MPWLNKDPFYTLAAVIFAVISILMAFNKYHNDRAVDQSILLGGEQQRQTLEAASLLASGQAEADYGWTQAYRLWEQYASLAQLVAENEPLAETYGAVRDYTQSLSALMQPPYFEGGQNPPDLSAFEAETYVIDLAYRWQQVEKITLQKAFWDTRLGYLGRNLTYCYLMLTVMGFATSLFEGNYLRYGTSGAIMVLWLYTAAVTVNALNDPFPTRSDEAIQAYADGVGWAHQGEYEQAAAAFTESITLEPDYTEAYVQRGVAAQSQLITNPDPQILLAATQDFERAVADGRRETNILRQLSRLYYIQGKWEDAIRISKTGSEETRDFIHTFDLGRNYLAQGDLDTAQTYYQAGFDQALVIYQAANGTPPLAFWRLFDLAQTDLDQLLGCAAQPDLCSKDLPTLRQDAAFLATVMNLDTLVKSWNVSLEMLGRPPQPTSATVDHFTVTLADEAVKVEFDYADVPENAHTALKIYGGGAEYVNLRQVWAWSAAESGSESLNFPMVNEAGVYQVQLYIEGQLLAQGAVEIDPQ